MGAADPATATDPTQTLQTASDNTALIARGENERKQLRRRLTWFRKTDDLDAAVFSMVESILDVPFDSESCLITNEDIDNFKESLPCMSKTPMPGFFWRIPFPFRMLRSILILHDTDPVPEDFFGFFALNASDVVNKLFLHLVWFLVFLGFLHLRSSMH